MSDKDKLIKRRDEIMAMNPIKRWLNKYELTNIEGQLHLIRIAEKMGHDLVYRYRLQVPLRGGASVGVMSKIAYDHENEISLTMRIPRKQFDLLVNEGAMQKVICFDD